ncbi:MAG: TVP38/TMEM64 family protein [Anaerolineae bacterium]|nr:TVP38/TMEM64 family protein [Anaerolineae bacterium]
MSEQTKSLRALIPGAIAFVVVTGALLIAVNQLGVDGIRQAIESAGPFAPLVYIFVKAVTYTVAPISSGPIQLFAGVLFGLIPGTLYTLLGELIGGSINFWLARRFGRAVVTRLVGADGMALVDKFVNQIVDWKTLIYARLFLFSIYDFISYAVGFSKLRYRTYLIISAVVGVIPTFVAALLGTALTDERSTLVAIYGIVAILSIVPLVFQKRIRRWLKLDRTETERTTDS